MDELEQKIAETREQLEDLLRQKRKTYDANRPERYRRGGCPRKLTDDNRLEACELRDNGEQIKCIADKFGVSESLISQHTRHLSNRKVRSDKK